MKKIAGDMLKATEHIPTFKLHKNADKHKEFQSEYNLFKNDLERLKEAIARGDIKAVRKLSESVDNACTRCHSKFK